MEEDRLLHGLALGRRDDEKRRRRVGQQRLDALRALLEALDEPAQRAEEDAQVLEQIDAGQALEHREHDARPAPDDPGGQAGRREEDLQRAPLEEARQPVGGVEEVQRVARRRRVEDEHVEAPGAVEVVELGDRRELLRAGHRAGQLLIDAVGEDVVAGALVGREAGDEVVERALGVEHHRPQLAAHLDPVAGEAVGVDEARLVAELVEPQGVGQPLGGVDGDDSDAQPARRQAHRQCRRRGRLADATRAGADDDALAVQSPVERHARRSASMCESVVSAPSSSWASNTNGSVTTGARASRRRRASCDCCVWWRAWPASAAATAGPSPAAARARASPAVKRPGSTPLATTRSTASPVSSGSARSSAIVSLTGISSGRATTTTPVRAGLESIASIVRPWRAMRPTRAVWANVRGAVRIATPWPVAG